MGHSDHVSKDNSVVDPSLGHPVVVRGLIEDVAHDAGQPNRAAKPSARSNALTIDTYRSVVVAALSDQRSALTPAELLASDDFREPGLYSWWVDEDGATELTDGLGETVSPGLIYAGLAGATRSVSKRKSTNTLYGRNAKMHLGGKRKLSTLRRALAAILSKSRPEIISESELTEWMGAHLRVILVPVADADTLDELETAVLRALDPPLNLAKMPATPIRKELRALRSTVQPALGSKSQS